MRRTFDGDYLRSLIFGLQDSLVSTTGVVIGLSTTIHDFSTVLLASVITVAVEAISMGAGQYISEQSVHELRPRQHHDNVLIGAGVMFVAYIIGGAIPILPIIFTPLSIAPIFSAVSTLIAFALIGYGKSRLTHTNTARSILSLVLIGGIATAVGILVGNLVQQWST